MSNYPEPYKFGEWNDDFAEDYLRADDDLRRMMLLEGGYDSAHESEVLRLFGPPPSSGVDAEPCRPEKSDEENNRNRGNLHKFLSAARLVFGAIFGFAGFLAAVATIISCWPAILSFFEKIIQFFK